MPFQRVSQVSIVTNDYSNQAEKWMTTSSSLKSLSGGFETEIKKIFNL